MRKNHIATITNVKSLLERDLGMTFATDSIAKPDVAIPTSPAEAARYIDHTALKATVTEDDIQQLCEDARLYGFASVCVNGRWVSKAVELLAGSSVMTITVVGFPLGAHTSESKAFQAQRAVATGAQEIDMVLSVGDLKAGQYSYVFNDIKAVVQAVSVPVKVILETSLLRPEEIVAGALIAKAAGASFVKTSTGFGGGGATVEDISLMRAAVGPSMGVKASGGVRSYQDLCEMIRAGATRIGASSGVAIVQGVQSDAGY